MAIFAAQGRFFAACLELIIWHKLAGAGEIMQDIWQDLWENRILICAVTAWLAAQLIKTVIYTVMNREWNWERLTGAGGMPSSHAATVSALAVSTLIHYGVSSFEFAISFVFAVVVLHDARGVRLETGRQAEILNHILRNFQGGEANPFRDVQLKELVGHTPLQVAVGCVLGIIVALCYF